MVKEKKELKIVFLKIGVAAALSFAIFIYDRIRTRKGSSNTRPYRPRPLDYGNDVDARAGRARSRDNIYVLARTSSSENITSVSAERCENAYMPRVPTDNSMVGISPSRKNSRDKERHLIPEFEDLMMEFDLASTASTTSPKKDADIATSDMGTPPAFRSFGRDDHEREIKHLKNRVRLLGEREEKLEDQLPEFYGVKEQQTTVMELQNCIKINKIEVKYLTFKIESLQADNQRLQAQVADHARTVVDLDAARSKIKVLKKKLRREVEQSREEILTLQNRISRLQDNEIKSTAVDSDIQFKLQKFKDLEAEADDLRKSNVRLHQEKSELVHQLECTQVLANPALDDPETEKLREHSKQLSEENENLAREVERLQGERLANVEETVYLRWVNACLRYELQDCQPPHGKPVARDLSKSLTPESKEKAKHLILEYGNTDAIPYNGMNAVDFKSDGWSASPVLYSAESVDNDEASASSKPQQLKRTKVFTKLRGLLHGKHHDKSNIGTEDPDSPSGSLSNLFRTETPRDVQSSRCHSPSSSVSKQSSRDWTRHSWDTSKAMSPRYSDAISCYSHRQASSAVDTDHGSLNSKLNPEPYSPNKLESVKLAEILKDSSSSSSSNRNHRSHSNTADFKSITDILHKKSFANRI